MSGLLYINIITPWLVNGFSGLLSHIDYRRRFTIDSFGERPQTQFRRQPRDRKKAVNVPR
jgi:hypothetical protein